jgi:hypothetical protein
MSWSEKLEKKPLDPVAIVFGIAVFLLIRWLTNKYVIPAIDNMEWRKDLRARADKVGGRGFIILQGLRTAVCTAVCSAVFVAFSCPRAFPEAGAFGDPTNPLKLRCVLPVSNFCFSSSGTRCGFYPEVREEGLAADIAAEEAEEKRAAKGAKGKGGKKKN